MGQKQTWASSNSDLSKALLLPLADIEGAAIGDARRAADHVCYRGCRVKRSDIDLLRDLDRIIDLNAEIPHRALDLGVAEQQLDRS